MLTNIEKIAKLIGFPIEENWNRTVVRRYLSSDKKENNYVELVQFPGRIEVGIHGLDGAHSIAWWPDQETSIKEIINYMCRNGV